MTEPSENPRHVADTAWDHAPCGLLQLDEHDRVVAANVRYLTLVGYQFADVHHRVFWNELLAVGSRLFFQTQLAPVLELEGVVSEVMVELRTATDDRIPALLNASRITDATGRRLGTRIALMSATDRRVYEAALRQARTDAESARDDAEDARAADLRARRRLELLAHANTALASSIDVGVAMTRLVQVLAEHIADWCLIFIPETDDWRQFQWATATRNPDEQGLVHRLAELLATQANATSDSTLPFLAAEHPILLTEVTEQVRRSSTDSNEARALYAELGIGSAAIVPSAARGSRVATITLARRPESPSFTADDLADLTDLAARAGIVIDNLRRLAREHSNSVTLQQALLTAPLPTPGLEIVSRYLPATNGNEVGGDWYDAFLQPDGRPVLVIGDVVGHDIHAAAAMGQLRGVIRTIGFTQAGTPAELLSRVDDVARGLGVQVLASTVVARVETEDAGSATVRWSNAGHPPPVLITGGGPQLLDRPPDRLLGLDPKLRKARGDHCVRLGSSDTLLLYTDGLVERAGEDIDVSLARLLAAAGTAAALPLPDLCDFLLSELRHGARDDIAVLGVRPDATAASEPKSR